MRHLAKWQLERLALHHGITERRVLERVLDDAERRQLTGRASAILSKESSSRESAQARLREALAGLRRGGKAGGSHG